ncbi:MAG: tail fiber domain-containing protein, partial [Lysobacterales bacterium]
MLLGVSDYDGAALPGGLETNLRIVGTSGTTGYIAVSNGSVVFGTNLGDTGTSMYFNSDFNAFEGSAYFDGRLEASGPNFTLYSGNAYKPGGGPFAVVSDVRLKQNIAPLGGALDRLLQLRGVTFEYRPDNSELTPAGPQIGFIAQEVREVFPSWVEEGKDGYLSVGSSGFEALTVEALRDLKAEKDVEVEALREENSTLRAELASIRKLLTELSANPAEPR